MEKFKQKTLTKFKSKIKKEIERNAYQFYYENGSDLIEPAPYFENSNISQSIQALYAEQINTLTRKKLTRLLNELNIPIIDKIKPRNYRELILNHSEFEKDKSKIINLLDHYVHSLDAAFLAEKVYNKKLEKLKKEEESRRIQSEIEKINEELVSLLPECFSICEDTIIQELCEHTMDLFLDSEKFEWKENQLEYWDNSGEIFSVGENQIEDFDTVQDFLDMYTGSWSPTFESGRGKSWGTFNDEVGCFFDESLTEHVLEFIVTQASVEKINTYLNLHDEEREDSSDFSKLVRELIEHDTRIFDETICEGPYIYTEFSEIKFNDMIEKGMNNPENKRRWNQLRLPSLFK